MVVCRCVSQDRAVIAVEKLASKHHAELLANHGPVVSGISLDSAMNAAEELEETAKLFVLLRGPQTRPLMSMQVEILQHKFPV